MDDHDIPEERIEAIKAEAEAIKAKVYKPGTTPMPDSADWDKRRKLFGPRVSKKDYQAMGIGITIPFGLLTSVGLGALVGYLLDKWRGGHTWLAPLVFVGFLVGCLFAYVSIQRLKSDK